MKKLLFSFTFCLLLMFCFSSTANADSAPRSIAIAVNDELIDSTTVSPLIVKGTTYVPIRFFSYSLDAKVYWDAHSKKVQIKKDRNSILIDSVNKTLLDNNDSISMQFVLNSLS